MPQRSNKDKLKPADLRNHRSTDIEEKSSKLPIPKTISQPSTSDTTAGPQAKPNDQVRRSRRLTNVDAALDGAALSIVSSAASSTRGPAKLQRRRTQPPRIPPRLQVRSPPSPVPKRTGLWVAYQVEKAKRQQEYEKKVQGKIGGIEAEFVRNLKGEQKQSPDPKSSSIEAKKQPEVAVAEGYDSDDTVRQTPLDDDNEPDAGPSKPRESNHIVIAEDLPRPQHAERAWTTPPNSLKVDDDIDFGDTSASSISSVVLSSPAENVFTPPTDDLTSDQAPSAPPQTPCAVSERSSTSPYYQRWFAGDFTRQGQSVDPAFVLSPWSRDRRARRDSEASTPTKQTRDRKDQPVELVLSPPPSLSPSLMIGTLSEPSTQSTDLRPAPLRVSSRRNTIMSEPCNHVATQTSLRANSPHPDTEIEIESSPTATYPWLSLSLIRQMRQTFRSEFETFQKHVDERLQRIEDRLAEQQTRPGYTSESTEYAGAGDRGHYRETAQESAV